MTQIVRLVDGVLISEDVQLAVDNFKTRAKFREDFLASGSVLIEDYPNWDVNTFGNDSAAILINAQGGQVTLIAGNGNGRFAELLWVLNTVNSDQNTVVEFYAKIDTITNFFCTWGLQEDGGHAAYFLVNVNGNFFETHVSNGTDTDVATSIPLDTNFHRFKIITSATEIKFFIDDILEVTTTTNIPTNIMRLDFFNETVSGMGPPPGGLRTFFLDFIDVESDRVS